MVNNLTKLKELDTVSKAIIPEEFEEHSYSEIVADITYRSGLSVLVLKLRIDYVITYELGLKSWNSTCITPELVIDDVKNNIEILKNTKVIPS